MAPKMAKQRKPKPVPHCGQPSYEAWLDWWARAVFGPPKTEPWLSKDTPEG